MKNWQNWQRIKSSLKRFDLEFQINYGIKSSEIIFKKGKTEIQEIAIKIWKTYIIRDSQEVPNLLSNSALEMS